MSVLVTLRRWLLLSLTALALVGGDGLHELLHHDGPRDRTATDQLHGQDCDDCAERETLRHEVDCLLCGAGRLGELDVPVSFAGVDVIGSSSTRPPVAVEELPRPEDLAAPLGARAPPRGA